VFLPVITTKAFSFVLYYDELKEYPRFLRFSITAMKLRMM